MKPRRNARSEMPARLLSFPGSKEVGIGDAKGLELGEIFVTIGEVGASASREPTKGSRSAIAVVLSCRILTLEELCFMSSGEKITTEDP